MEKKDLKEALLAEFEATECPCKFIITTPKHAKKDCPHFTYEAEKTWLSAALDRVEREALEVAHDIAQRLLYTADPASGEKYGINAVRAEIFRKIASLPTLAERE